MMNKRVLFIAGHEFLYNPQNGGQKCSLRNYRMIQSIFGEKNTFLCMFSNYQYNNLLENEKIFPTQKNNFELLINTITRRNVCNNRVLRKAKKHIETLNIDCVFSDSSTIGYLVSKLGLNKPILFFFHNIERNYAWNKFKHEGKKYLVAYWSYAKNEELAVKIANKVILLNKRDEEELYRLYNRGADYFLPITFKDEFDLRESKQ